MCVSVCMCAHTYVSVWKGLQLLPFERGTHSRVFLHWDLFPRPDPWGWDLA